MVFNPIRDFALHGSGFSGGKERILNFFSQNHKPKEEIDFLKKEYGTGGFGIPYSQPYELTDGWGDSKGFRVKWYNEDKEICERKFTYEELREEIHKCINENIYISLTKSTTIHSDNDFIYNMEQNGQLSFI